MRIGIMKYINSIQIYAPFELGIIDPPGQITYETPSNLNKAIEQNQLDVSMVSSHFYLQNQETLSLLPNFCIGGHGPVKSVNLHTKVPLSQLDGQKIGITAQTATSVKLLEVLCHHFWNVSPSFEPLNNEPTKHPAFLLIGDQALKNPSFPGYTNIDLSEAWYLATGLAFTFGVVVARKSFLESSPDQVELFNNTLKKAHEWSFSNPEKVLELAQKKSSLPPKVLKQYLDCIRLEFNEAQKKGLEKFAKITQEIKVPC